MYSVDLDVFNPNLRSVFLIFALALPYDSTRPRQHIWRDCKADLLSCLEIDDKLELHRLFDWDVGRFGAFQDLVDKVSGAPV